MSEPRHIDACPDAELMAGLLENRLDAPTRAAIERHLAQCPHCLDVVAAVAPASDDGLIATEPTIPSRRLLRGTIAAGLAFVVTAAVAYGGAQLALRGLARALSARASAALGDRVDVGTLRIAIAPRAGTLSLGFDRIAIGGRARARSTADALDVMLGLAPLIHGTVRVDGVRLLRPVFHVTAPADDPAGPRPARELAEVAALAALAPIAVVDGTVIVERRTAAPLRIDAIDGTLTPRSDALHITIGGKSGTARIDVSGTAALDAAATLDLEVLTSGASAADLAVFAPDLPPTAAADASIRITGPAAAPQVSVRAAAKPALR